jgi:hypothetical protein
MDDDYSSGRPLGSRLLSIEASVSARVPTRPPELRDGDRRERVWPREIEFDLAALANEPAGSATPADESAGRLAWDATLLRWVSLSRGLLRPSLSR